ncbi:hypothetical protein ACFYWU_28560 [Streptomyces chrestomyceticus]|uniref:hypothetical protein n=1 Tax=Streptomyces chrestomyceticus TaxID=68185 RepID=UPI00368772E8
MLAATTRETSALPAAAIVASCALAFTILSFWWLNARQGRLKAYEPHSFAAAVTSEKTLIRVPLILFNTGPKPIVVQNFRLVIQEGFADPLFLDWKTTRDRLRPERGDDPRLPSVFVVDGRSAIQLFIEFGTSFPNFIPERREYSVAIEYKLGHRKGWGKLLTFSLRLDNLRDPEKYLPYSNEPGGVSEEDRRRAQSALESLKSIAESNRVREF